MASYGGSAASLQRRSDQGQQPSHIYQIDFAAVASGKRIASTKRRVRWRFGFASNEALQQGKTGMECRGDEHDITLVWSITSGKRLVLADGHEVHFSNSRSGIFDFSWTMKGGHVMKIVAHASPPLSEKPGFRQYDFFVDGQSFFSFPKMFRMGMKDTGRNYGYSEASAALGGYSRNDRLSQEEADIERAIKASLMDSGTAHNNSQHKDEIADLLDFGTDPIVEVAPTPTPVPATGGQQVPDFSSFYPSNFAPPVVTSNPFGQQNQPVNRDRVGSVSSHISAPPPSTNNMINNDSNSVFSAPNNTSFVSSNPFDVASSPAQQPPYGSNMQGSKPAMQTNQPVSNAVVMHPQQQTGNYGYNNYNYQQQPPPLAHHQQQTQQGYGVPPPLPHQQNGYGQQAYYQQQQGQQNQYYGR